MKKIKYITSALVLLLASITAHAEVSKPDITVTQISALNVTTNLGFKQQDSNDWLKMAEGTLTATSTDTPVQGAIGDKDFSGFFIGVSSVGNVTANDVTYHVYDIDYPLTDVNDPNNGIVVDPNIPGGPLLAPRRTLRTATAAAPSFVIRCNSTAGSLYLIISNGKAYGTKAIKDATQFTAYQLAYADHQGVKVMDPVAPTCTQNGKNAYYQCQICQKYFQEQACTHETTPDLESIPAIGHVFKNGSCTRTGCKAKLTYLVPTYKKNSDNSQDATLGIDSWSTQLRTEDAIRVLSSTTQVTWPAGWYYVSGEVTLTQGAICDGAVHLILCDGAKLTVNGGTNGEAGIRVIDSNSLTIYAQSEGAQKGALSATGGRAAAGIGGKLKADGKNITINGGKVTANGVFWGAGIGGGQVSSGQYIVINGGEVEATGGTSAAGIGGGYEGHGQNITINGGVVTAKGGPFGAGIGSGYGADKNGTDIRINGGTVTATGGGANNTRVDQGIGCGRNGNYTNNTIYVSTALIVKAGYTANPTSVVSNNGGNLTESFYDIDLGGKQYITIHEHPVARPVWTWADDCSDATADFSCAHGDLTAKLSTSTTPEVIISPAVSPATCTADGYTTYNAHVLYNDKTYNAPEKVVTTPALGHNYVNGVCTRCSKLEPIDTENARVYASVQQNGTKIDKLGTAAYNVSSGSITLDFGEYGVIATLKSGTTTVAELPMKDGAQMVLEFSTTVPEANLNKVSKTVTQAGVATIFSPFQLQVPANSNVEVYAPEYDAASNVLKCTSQYKVAPGTILPAGSALLLENPGDIDFQIAQDAPTKVIDYWSLAGYAVDTPLSSIMLPADYAVCTLGKSTDSDDYGFFRFTGTTLAAGSGLLIAHNGPYGARGISIVFDDDEETATDISGLNADDMQTGTHKYLENGRIVIKQGNQKYNVNGQKMK